MLNRIIAFLFIALLSSSSFSSETPDLAGDWAGTLNMGGGSLRLIFHITKSEDSYGATIESVDQGGAMIPTSLTVDGTSLLFTVEQIDVQYKATVSGNEIVGVFTQFGMSMPDFTIKRAE